MQPVTSHYLLAIHEITATASGVVIPHTVPASQSYFQFSLCGHGHS